MSIGLPTNGDIINTDEMNWDDVLPSMHILFPSTGPLILIGALPSFDSQRTPQPFKALRSGSMGLFITESSPTIVVSESNNAAIPVMSLMVVPEFSTSIIILGARISLDPTQMRSSAQSMDAPIVIMASAVALVSNESSGLVITHFPRESAAKMIALCVQLFDAGADMVPSISPPENVISIISSS